MKREELQNEVMDRLRIMEMTGATGLPFPIDSEACKEIGRMIQLLEKYYKRYDKFKDISADDIDKEYEIIFDIYQEPDKDGNIMLSVLSDEAKESIDKTLKEHDIDYSINRAGVIDIISINNNDNFEAEKFFNYLMSINEKKKLKRVELVQVNIPRYMFNAFMK